MNWSAPRSAASASHVQTAIATKRLAIVRPEPSVVTSRERPKLPGAPQGSGPWANLAVCGQLANPGAGTGASGPNTHNAPNQRWPFEGTEPSLLFVAVITIVFRVMRAARIETQEWWCLALTGFLSGQTRASGTRMAGNISSAQIDTLTGQRGRPAQPTVAFVAAMGLRNGRNTYRLWFGQLS